MAESTQISPVLLYISCDMNANECIIIFKYLKKLSKQLTQQVYFETSLVALCQNVTSLTSIYTWPSSNGKHTHAAGNAQDLLFMLLFIILKLRLCFTKAHLAIRDERAARNEHSATSYRKRTVRSEIVSKKVYCSHPLLLTANMLNSLKNIGNLAFHNIYISNLGLICFNISKVYLLYFTWCTLLKYSVVNCWNRLGQ